MTIGRRLPDAARGGRRGRRRAARAPRPISVEPYATDVHEPGKRALIASMRSSVTSDVPVSTSTQRRGVVAGRRTRGCVATPRGCSRGCSRRATARPRRAARSGSARVHEVDGAIARPRVLDEVPARHVEQTEHHDVAAPSGGAAPRRRAAMARSQAARCESTAPFDTPVEPLVRKMLLTSSLSPTRGGARGRRRRRPPRRGHEHREPDRLGDRARDVLVLGCATTTTRPQHLERVDAASGSVKFGLIGASAAPSLLMPYADARARRARSAPTRRTRSPGATPAAARRCAARLAPVSSSREGAGFVAEGRADPLRAHGGESGEQVVDADVHRGRSLCGRAGRVKPAPGGRRLSSLDVVDEASLLADVDRQLQAVVATFGEPVAGALGPIAASGHAIGPAWCSSWPGTATATLAVQGAAAVELLHLGTLVHDDIVDGSPLRRHSPTLHTALGMPVALWTADALYAEALHLADAVTPAGRARARRRAPPHRRQPDPRGARCHDRALLGRGRRQDGVAVRGVVRPRRRGRRRRAPRLAARRGASVRTPVPVRRRPAGHRR